MLTAYFEANRYMRKLVESSTVISPSILRGNLMENFGSGENIKTVAKLVELSRLIRLKVNATIFVFS